jgi:hypothetical protein
MTMMRLGTFAGRSGKHCRIGFQPVLVRSVLFPGDERVPETSSCFANDAQRRKRQAGSLSYIALSSTERVPLYSRRPLAGTSRPFVGCILNSTLL